MVYNQTAIIQSQGLKQSLIVIIGNSITAFFAAITTIYISRNLGPREFGVFSASYAFVLLFLKLADFGINIATQRRVAKYPESARDLGNIVFTLKILVAISFCVIALILFDEIGINLLHLKRLYIIRWLLFFSGIGFLFDFATQYLDGLHQFKHSVIANIIRVSSLLFALIIGFSISSPNIFLVSLLFVLSPIVGLIYALSHTHLKPIAITIASIKKIKPILRDTKYVGVSVLALAAADNLDIILVKYFTDGIQTGWYAAADKIGTFLNFMALSMLVVLSVRVARYQNQEIVKRYLINSIKVGIAAVLIAFMVLPLSHFALIFTAGPEYLAANSALKIIIIASGITFATTPFYAVFYRFNSPQFYSFYGWLLIITLLSSSVILIPKLGIIGSALAQLIMRTSLGIFTVVFAFKQLPTLNRPS